MATVGRIDVDRWRVLLALLGVVTALAGAVVATDRGASPDGTSVASRHHGMETQHNQVLL